MVVKYFAQIDFDLFSEPVFRSLSSNDVRFIYLTAHCSKLSNYVGLFRYPKEIWGYDANVKPVEIDAAIVELERCGLVEYDISTQTLRLVGWFKNLYGPANGNQMKSHIKSFRGLSEVDPGMFCRTVAEFTVASFRKSIHWEPNSPEHSKIGDAFRPFLSTMFFRFGELFTQTLQAEIEESGREARSSIGAVFHLLPGVGDSPVKPFRNGSQTVSEQEKRIKDNKLEEKRKHAEGTIDLGKSGKPTAQAKNSRLAIEARKSQSWT